MKAPTHSAYATISVEEREEKNSALPIASSLSISKEDEDMGGETWTRGEVQPAAYRDKKFAIAFLVHLFLIFAAAPFGPSTVKNIYNTNINGGGGYRFLTSVPSLVTPKRSMGESYYFDEEQEDIGEYYGDVGGGDGYDEGELGNQAFDQNPFIGFDANKTIQFFMFVVMASLAISTGFVIGALYFLQRQAEKVIKGSLFCIIAYFTIFGLLFLGLPTTPSANGYYGLSDEELSEYQTDTQQAKVIMAAVLFIFALVFVCYTKAVWPNIPFAASTMRTGVTACKANLGVFAFAFVTPLLNLFLFIMQIMALNTGLNLTGGFNEDPSDGGNTAAGIVMLLFSLSFYWTAEVVKNISTVIVSGTVGTWWFSPLEASSFCSSAVVDSFKRATTYSFGSICCGSLLVAILNIIIDTLRRSRRNRSCILLFCVITCLLEILERLAEYFNKWAFVYVGLYGYDYMTAGKNVVTLFKARGFSSIISDRLVHRALMTVAFFISLVTGMIITLIWNLFEIGSKGPMDVYLSVMYFFAVFFISLLNANILLSVVGTASDTAVVCFAEASAEFEENHPQLSAIMHETYAQAWPEVDFRREVV